VRLNAVGKGEDEPLDPRNPASDANRRVEIGFVRKN
jgi:flagellar motor protein MotB